jgi:hypothetical protein
MCISLFALTQAVFIYIKALTLSRENILYQNWLVIFTSILILLSIELINPKKLPIHSNFLCGFTLALGLTIILTVLYPEFGETAIERFYTFFTVLISVDAGLISLQLILPSKDENKR